MYINLGRDLLSSRRNIIVCCRASNINMEHSNSESNDHSSSSDSEEDIYSPHHPNNLRPYDFEPEAVVSGDNVALRENEGALSYESRIGNINWCVCGNCQRMETEEESRCCREVDEVPEEFFSGHPCVTGNEDFRTVLIELFIECPPVY